MMQKISDKKHVMITKQSKTYALEFFGKTIILLSSQDKVIWHEVGLADMGDPGFREMMKDFHAVVSAHGLRQAKIALFLPLEDVILRTISGDNPAQTLATDANLTVEEISFTLGEADKTGQYSALYAYRETLQEAAAFLAQFDFSTTYFSVRNSVLGFTKQPKLYLTNKIPTVLPPLIWPSVAAAAVVAIGAISILYSSPSIETSPRPELQLSVVQITKPPEQPTPAKIMKASLTQTVEMPITAAAFDANDFDILVHKLSTQTKLSTNAITTIVFPDQVVINPTYDGGLALPELNGLATRPLALNKLSASAEAPIVTAFSDNISSPTEPLKDLTDSAVPEDADYPRPKRREITPTVTTVVTVEPLVAEVAPTTPRPPRRPVGLRSSASTTQAAIAQDLVQQAIKEDAVAARALTSASARAVGTGKRPPLKTSNFRAIVKRAAAKSSSTTVTTKTVSVSKPSTTNTTTNDKTTRASTTFSKGALSLVGVFGAPSKRSALFRTSTGGYRSVKIGQRVAGWKVVSISESSAKVSKGSRTKTMRVP
jgi:hypothetical protein